MSTWANRILCIISYAIRNYNTTRTLCSLVATKFDFFFSKYFIRIAQILHRNFSWFDWKLLFWLYDKWFTDANANVVLLPLNKLYELKLAHIRVISKRPTDRNQKIELSWYSHWNSFIKCNIHLNQRKIAHWPCRCDNKMLTSLLLIR